MERSRGGAWLSRRDHRHDLRAQRVGTKDRHRRAGLRAAALIVAALIAPAGAAAALGARAQSSEDPRTKALLESLAPYLETVPYAKELALAATGEGPAGNASLWASAVASRLLERGAPEPAIRLLDAVLERFPEQKDYLPHLLYQRADLWRYLFEHDKALRDLDRAEQALTKPRPADALLVQVIGGVRMQVYIDLGLLDPAYELYKSTKLESDALAGALSATEPAARAKELLYYQNLDGWRIELCRRNHAECVKLMDKLLSEDDLYLAFMDDRDAFELDLFLRRGLAHAELARDKAAAGDQTGAAAQRAKAQADLDHVLDRDLEHAIESGALTAEDEWKGLLARVDLASQSGDAAARERDLAKLEEMNARESSGAKPQDRARLAAFRARRLLDGGADAKAIRQELTRLSAAYGEVEQDWLQTKRPPEGLGYLHWDVQTLILSTWVDLLLASDSEDGKREALQLLARAQALGTLALHLGGPSIAAQAGERAERYVAHLPEHSGVVAFLPSLDVTHVFAADASGVICERASSRRRLEWLAERVMRDARREPPDLAKRAQRADRIAANAKALAGELFPPAVAAKIASWKRVAFVGSELFGDPALEVLPLEGKVLGETHAVSYLPGLALADLLAEAWPAPAPELDVLLVAGPARGDELGLDLGDATTSRLAELVGAARLRSGADAYLDEGALAGAEILALLAHGHYDAALPRPAMVALAEPPNASAATARQARSFLTCASLEQRGAAGDLPPLVLFLTCQAAAGPNARGDAGASHLGGAAMLGGARAVLIAPNDVALAAALPILETLVRHLGAGDAPDEALRQARVALAADPKLSDPFYTSSLRLFGAAHLPLAAGAASEQAR